MGRYGAVFGPDITFAGVDPRTPGEPETFVDVDVVFVGAVCSHRPGPRAERPDFTATPGRHPPPGVPSHRRLDVVEVSLPYDHPDITVFPGNRIVLEAPSGTAACRRRRHQAAGPATTRGRRSKVGHRPARRPPSG